MSEQLYCAVDVGGTKTFLYLIGAGRRVISKARFATPVCQEASALVEGIEQALLSSLQRCDRSPAALHGIGVCIAGLVDFYHGIVHQSANIGWSAPVPFRDILEQRWPCPVYIDNDANAAILGEATYGAARGHRQAIYVTVSTGIGSGLYLDGRIYRGGSGFAGEIGHLKAIDGKGMPCGCGGMDCLETWASGEAIARQARELWEERERREIDTAWVFKRAGEGDPVAAMIINSAAQHIAVALANLVTLLNPTCLVLGGTVVSSSKAFFEQISDKIYHLAVNPAVSATRMEIVPAGLEPEAGIWGIYAMMQEYAG